MPRISMPAKGGQGSPLGLLSQQGRQCFCACAGGLNEGVNGGCTLSRDVSEASGELGGKSGLCHSPDNNAEKVI